MSDGLHGAENISVVVCTRNRPELLTRCLEGLAELDPQAKEVLIMDQSDTGESAELVQQYMGKIRDLRHLAVVPRGISHSRNVAVRAARGEILAFTDDDCLVRPDWIRQIAKAFAQDPKPVMVTGGSLPSPGEEIHPRIAAAATWHSEEVRNFSRPIDPTEVGSGFNLSFRTSWVEKVGLFDLELGTGGPFKAGEDSDFIHRTLRAGGIIRYEPEVVVAHATWRDGHRQSQAEYGYGYGLAAWALKNARHLDLYPLRVALISLASYGKRLLSGLLRRDVVGVKTGWAYVSGLGRGTVHWLFGRRPVRPTTQEDSGRV